MECVLGIDIGSSSVKLGAFALDGHPICIATRDYVTEEPRAGWREQDAEVWWESVAQCAREIQAQIDAREILGIGCTGHLSSHTFVDQEGRPLRPSLGFQDQRALRETEELASLMSREALAAELEIDLPPAPSWPLPRLMWFRNHEPATLEKASYLVQAKDFVNFRLTGDFASDASSNRGLVNFSTGREPEELLRRLGLPVRLLPSLYAPHAVIGRISKAAEQATGLPKGLPVVTGWNDLNASVLGSGTIKEGDLFDVTGSSEHVGMVTSKPLRLPELTYAPFLKGKNLFYGVISSGGASLGWYCQTFGITLEEAAELAVSVAPGAESLFFLPYLNGERSPVWDARAAGAFVGIRSHHRQGHFVRAVLEGVAFDLFQILELVESEHGPVAGPIVISGGAAQMELWNEIKANVWRRSCHIVQTTQTGSLGAAMLAAVGVGAYQDCEAAARGMARVSKGPTVVPEISARYRQAYGHFRNLYPSLREHFAQTFTESVEPDEPERPSTPQKNSMLR